MSAEVGFDETKLNDPVSELSTGWRMRLTLAVSMLKHADLVLLDEPTCLAVKIFTWLQASCLGSTQEPSGRRVGAVAQCWPPRWLKLKSSVKET